MASGVVVGADDGEVGAPQLGGQVFNAEVEFVVAQRAGIVVHAVHQAYLDLAVEEGEERRPLTEIAAVEE